MKRYWVFKMDTYYPLGGLNDFHSDYDTLEEALKVARKYDYDMGHVLDTVDKVLIGRDGNNYPIRSKVDER